MKETYKGQDTLSISINLTWKKLDKYYSMMDNTPAYAAALFLHPSHRFKYFQKRWVTPALRSYQETTLRAIRKLYTDEYKQRLTKEAIQELDEEAEQEKNVMAQWFEQDSPLKDEFEAYLEEATTTLSLKSNLFT
jgi:hypothetical protein